MYCIATAADLQEPLGHATQTHDFHKATERREMEIGVVDQGKG